MTASGPWGSSDILLAFGADDVGSNPTGPAKLLLAWRLRKADRKWKAILRVVRPEAVITATPRHFAIVGWRFALQGVRSPDLAQRPSAWREFGMR